MATERITKDVLAIPASPNWYCSRAIDINDDGIIAFASRQDVVLMHLRLAERSLSSSTLAPWPFYLGMVNFHKERIAALSFSPFADHTLVTVADDLQVALTDVRSMTTVGLHHEHKSKPTCVCWMRYDIAVHVVSGDEGGQLISANIVSKKLRCWRPARGTVTCIVSCPQQTHIVAVGYQTGLILVVDLQKDAEVLCSLRHHDADVQSLCWAPFDGTGPLQHLVRDYNQLERLLASSSRDRTIRVWSVQHATPILTLSVPSKVTAPQRRQKDEHTWVTVAWPNSRPDVLLSSSPSGAMLTWDLTGSTQQPWSVFGRKTDRQHSRAVFNVACHRDFAVTISMDRQIIFWQLSKGHQLFSLSTLGGFAYCLNFSPINSGVFAVGCGDCILRTWNLTAVDNPFDIATFWQGIKSKVTSLAWHPKKEGIVAFGTEEGRVGICNVLSSKPSVVFPRTHHHIVYTLVWGPSCPTQGSSGDGVTTFQLYSCGTRHIFIHDPQAVDKPATDLNDVLKHAGGIMQAKPPQRTEFVWNDDFTIFTLGNKDGSVELYLASTLCCIGVITSHVRVIHCLRWHPVFTMESTTPSSFCNWLAISAQDPSIHIHDLTDIVSSDSAGQQISITTCSLQLVGHGAAVATVAWNPHIDGQLVSASFDHTVRVWNVAEQTVIACFCGHSARVLCAEWSPLNPDLIVSGSEDFTVQMWKITEQDTKPSSKVTKAIEKLQSKYAKKVKPITTSLTTDDNPSNSDIDLNVEIAHLLSERKMQLLEQTKPTQQVCLNESTESNVTVIKKMVEDICMACDATSEADSEIKRLPATSHEIETTSSKTESQQSTKKKRTKKKSGVKSLFPLTSTLENRGKAFTLDDCVALVDHAKADGQSVITSSDFGVGTHANLGMYGGRVDAYRLLKTEAENHMTCNNMDYALQLEVWKGNIAGAVKMAAESEQLCDWLISLAATVSPSFWSEMCSHYVHQLVSEGQPHKAVLYLLADHKVHEAVEVLKTHASYKEAVILAKVRLPPKDPHISRLMDEWAEQLQKEGNVESAAKCLLAAGYADLAAAILSRKRDAPSSRIGAYIAVKLGHNCEVAQSFAELCMRDCLVSEDYVTANKLIAEHPTLKMYRPVMHVLQHLNASLRDQSTHEMDRRLQDVLTEALDSIRENNDGSEEDWKRVCDVLSCFTETLTPQKENEVTAWLAVLLVRHALCCRVDDCSDAEQLLLDAFAIVHKSGNISRLMWLDHVLNTHLSLNEKSEAIRTYMAVASLHGLLNHGKSCLPKRDEDPCDHYSECPCSDTASKVNLLLDNLLSNDHAELTRLRTRQTYTKVALASAIARSKGSEDMSTTFTNTDIGVVPADRLIEHSEITVADLQMECSRLDDLLAAATTRMQVCQFPDPFESVLLLAELCTLHLREGCQCQPWIDVLHDTVAFGRRCIALQRQIDKLAVYEEILESKGKVNLRPTN